MVDVVTCAIPGTKWPDQSDDNFTAADLPPLSEDTILKIRELYDRLIRAQAHHHW